jgi:CRISPR/Cas system-associated exonuclease Cas4 (RecB family)
MPTSLPVINRPIDNTALSTYMKCPREFKLSMLEGWRPKKRNTALNYGALWHSILEMHFKTGGDQEKILATFAVVGPKLVSEDHRTAARALQDYTKYVRTYPTAADTQATIGFPAAPLVELATAVKSEVFDHEYAGKIDRIAMLNSEQAVIEDHKTSSRLDKNFFAMFSLSNQMKGYTWIGQKLLPNIQVIGVRIDLAHILKDKTSFERHVIHYTKSSIEEWEENTANWFYRIRRSIQEDDFPAHFGDNGCSSKYGKCQFFDVCASSKVIRQKVLEQDFHIDPWDPLKNESLETQTGE